MANRRDPKLHDRLAAALEVAEARLVEACRGALAPDNPCIAAAQHHFAAGGGRVRARICLQVSFGLGLAEADALRLAVCCELLHNASLVQDDLLDRTALRRGQASIWALWGETVAVCTGDLMLAGAYAELAAIEQPGRLPALLLHVHGRTREVILGQAAEKSGPAPRTLAEYERLATGKSASLLALAVELPLLTVWGAPANAEPLWTGQDARRVDAQAALLTAWRAATAFALAYQIADDLQDVRQDRGEGSLNVVALLEAGGMGPEEARATAMGRARGLLAEAQRFAAALPPGCAPALDEQVAKLLGVLQQSAPDVRLPGPLSPAA